MQASKPSSATSLLELKVVMAKTPSLKSVDLKQRLADKQTYQERLTAAQLRLLFVQRQMHQQKKSAILVFEGWDAAGKGGSIRRLVESLDPRGYVVHLIGAPTEEEKQRNYLFRFLSVMPKAGCLGIFDRSWYGRVLVERVEGFAKQRDWLRAYDEINAFEKMYHDDGVPVVKFFLHISKDEQLKRFKDREHDPFKSWKIGPDDWRNRERWEDYEVAIEEMFQRTSTAFAPWRVVPAEYKWAARVEVAETCVRVLTEQHGLESELPKGWRKLGE